MIPVGGGTRRDSVGNQNGVGWAVEHGRQLGCCVRQRAAMWPHYRSAATVTDCESTRAKSDVLEAGSDGLWDRVVEEDQP